MKLSFMLFLFNTCIFLFCTFYYITFCILADNVCISLFLVSNCQTISKLALSCLLLSWKRTRQYWVRLINEINRSWQSFTQSAKTSQIEAWTKELLLWVPIQIYSENSSGTLVQYQYVSNTIYPPPLPNSSAQH